MTPQVCPVCGADVPRGARACPECGSDEKTGWSEAAETGGLDLPDEEFDYKDFVKREFGKEGPVPQGTKKAWWIVAVIVLLLFIFLILR